MTTGKCTNKRAHDQIDPPYRVVRFEWTGKPLLREARCPLCGFRLAQTTRSLKAPVMYKKPNS